MSDTNYSHPEIAIADLLTRTLAAHGRYEKEVLGGKRDDDWPVWYAHHLREIGLLNHIPDGPGRELIREQLESLLARADDAYRAEQPDSTWQSYYAGYLLAVAKEHIARQAL